jgi:hypothetical protein
MIGQKATTIVMAFGLIAGVCTPDGAWGNGGPFVVKYPGGDPAAKGVLARLDPSLMPGRETRLRVLEENLAITFQPHDGLIRPKASAPPLVTVSAEYTIENPTDQAVPADFGFPILRGIYINPLSMAPRPDVRVTVRPAQMAAGTQLGLAVPQRGNPTAQQQAVQATIISNSAIYGIIRARAREIIGREVAADRRLAALMARVRAGGEGEPQVPRVQQAQQVSYWQQETSTQNRTRTNARAALVEYLMRDLGWNDRDAALMVEYGALDFSNTTAHPWDRWRYGMPVRRDAELSRLAQSNLGPLAAIGEQKATQFFVQLASRFDRDTPAAYQALFDAWGGDVRERSVDLVTGAIRPREVDVVRAGAPAEVSGLAGYGDPTVYARVDYLDPRAKISPAEKLSCRRVLQNLPVVFTFAPMNLLHYQVSFPANGTRVVTVTYRQYAYVDTRAPASYQLAYVVHPASLWDAFGPIHLTVRVPKGLDCRASVAMRPGGGNTSAERPAAPLGTEMETYQTTLTENHEKTGEMFVAVGRAAWDRHFVPRAQPADAAGQ